MLTFMLDVVGGIGLPSHLKDGYGDVDGSGGGLLGLVSNLVRLIIIVGGLWAFINLVLAGFSYVVSGDKPDELAKAHARIYMSVIGLVVMVGSFALTMVVSFLLYGDPSAIFNPELATPGGVS